METRIKWNLAICTGFIWHCRGFAQTYNDPLNPPHMKQWFINIVSVGKILVTLISDIMLSPLWTCQLTALFTKLPDCVPPYRTLFRDHSSWWLPFTANGHFSVPQELYQAKPGCRKADGFVNSTIMGFFKGVQKDLMMNKMQCAVEMSALTVPKWNTAWFTKPPASWFPAIPWFDWYYSIIPPFHWKNVPEAVNGGIVSGAFLPVTFFLFCREQPVTNSDIHKAAGLMVPGCSMIWLVLYYLSTIPSLKPLMGEWSLGVIPVCSFFWEQPATKEPVALWIELSGASSFVNHTVQCDSKNHRPHGSRPFHDFARYNS